MTVKEKIVKCEECDNNTFFLIIKKINFHVECSKCGIEQGVYRSIEQIAWELLEEIKED
jgi:ribosomal protein S27E